MTKNETKLAMAEVLLVSLRARFSEYNATDIKPSQISLEIIKEAKATRAQIEAMETLCHCLTTPPKLKCISKCHDVFINEDRPEDCTFLIDDHWCRAPDNHPCHGKQCERLYPNG